MKATRIHGWWMLASVLFAGVLAMLGQEQALADVGKSDLSVTQKQEPKTVSGPSEIIFPPANVPIVFDHAQHHALGLACIECHKGAKSSRRASDRLSAPGTACDRCHKTNHDDLGAVKAGEGVMGACATCHEGYAQGDGNRVNRAITPTANLHFSHQIHDRRNIGCGQCHGAVHRMAKATGASMPQMRTCLRCHGLPDVSRGDAKAGCPTCHLTENSGMMRTKYPQGRLLPPRWMGAAEHGPDFVNTHGPVAARDSAFCGRCHGEDDCARCHDGRVRPRSVHPNDFLSMHGLAAKQNAQSCNSCHRHESFCKTCHMRAGVTATGPTAARTSQGRIHPSPEIFVSRPVTGRHHSVEARRNLMSCVGCHVERDCVGCHGTKGGGGMGVNPHPAGFINRCASALSKNGRSCLVCHDPGDPMLARCR